MNVGESHPAFPRKTTPGVPALRPTQLCDRPASAHREPLPRIAQIADSIHDLDVGAGPPPIFACHRCTLSPTVLSSFFAPIKSPRHGTAGGHVLSQLLCH
jgi:hypothetical protein